MSLLLMSPKLATEPVPTEKRRGRLGIKTIFDKTMAKGEKVTLEEAIAILKASW